MPPPADGLLPLLALAAVPALDSVAEQRLQSFVLAELSSQLQPWLVGLPPQPVAVTTNLLDAEELAPDSAAPEASLPTAAVAVLPSRQLLAVAAAQIQLAVESACLLAASAASLAAVPWLPSVAGEQWQ